MRNVWWWTPMRHQFRRCLKIWVCPNIFQHTLKIKWSWYQLCTSGWMEVSLKVVKAVSTGKGTQTIGLASKNHSVISLLNMSVMWMHLTACTPYSLQQIRVWVAIKVTVSMLLNRLFNIKLSVQFEGQNLSWRGWVHLLLSDVELAIPQCQNAFRFF